MPYGLELKDLIIFIAGAAIALLAGYFFYRKGLQKKTLVYAVRVRSLVYRSQNYPEGLKGGLKISFDGRDVSKLMRVTVFVWNSGNQPITRQDLDTKSHLRISFREKGFEALQTTISDQTRKANNAQIDNDILTFDYLNPKDGFVVDIFGDANDEENKVTEHAVKVEGEVVGATSDIGRTAFQFSASRAPGYLLFVMGLLFGASVLLSLYDPSWTTHRSPEIEKAFNAVFGVFFGAVSVSLLLGGSLVIFLTKKMPRTLLSRDQETKMIPWIARILPIRTLS